MTSNGVIPSRVSSYLTFRMPNRFSLEYCPAGSLHGAPLLLQPGGLQRSVPGAVVGDRHGQEALVPRLGRPVAQVGPFFVQMLEPLYDALRGPMPALADQLVIESRPADGTPPGTEVG